MLTCANPLRIFVFFLFIFLLFQSMVPKKGGTSAVASYLALLTFVGTMGPLVVGALHDSGWQLKTLLFLSVSCPFAVAGLLFVGLAMANSDGFYVLAGDGFKGRLSDDGEGAAVWGGERDGRDLVP